MADRERRRLIFAHQEWLGFVQPVGLVVSPAVLVDAQVAPDRNIAGRRRTFTALLDRDDSGATTRWRAPDLRRLFTGWLGWEEDDLVDAGAHRDVLEIALPELQAVLAPTWAVPAEGGDGGWSMLVRVEDAGADLDVPPAEAAWNASRHERFVRLLAETGVPVGLLCTDERVRLIHAPGGETPGHLTFDFSQMAMPAGRPILAAFDMLLSAEALFGVEEASLPVLLARSREAQAEVSTRLARQVLAALYALLRGFVAADAGRGALPAPAREAPDGNTRNGAPVSGALPALAREAPDRLYAGLIGVLMRLVFLLYAEDRGMMPDHPVYQQHYALGGLFARLRTDVAAYPDTMDQRFGAWAQLLSLFRLVHGGGGHAGLSFVARRGRLFDPARFPFLEGFGTFGTLEEGERNGRPELPLVPDETVWRVLQNMMLLDGERLSYRTLDVEQIGSVYEAIMGFRIELTAGRSIAVRSRQRTGAAVVVDLDALLAVDGNKRARILRDRTDQKPSGNAAAALRTAETVEDLVAALESRIDRDATPDVVPAGTPVLQPTDERRRSGSHYTPSTLTEPIVADALRPVLDRLGRRPAPERILDLRVLDPAMGSGAFLVEACRQLARRLVDAWNAHGGPPAVPPDEDELLHARRLVAQQCLYGVDKNAMAVDLAGLSLWLVMFAKDHEFTFVDHALRHGDALAGLTLAQIEALHWRQDAPPQREMAELLVREQVAKAVDLRAHIHAAKESASEDELRGLLNGAKSAVAGVRAFGDSVLAAFFQGTKPRERKSIRKRLVDSILSDDAGRYRSEIDAWRTADPPLTPFHWEIEFPEVFERDNPGFDAIVGNPPFLGGKRISTTLGSGYRDWLAALHMESSSNADLVAHFFRRAFDLVRRGGAFGLIATNTIAQGDTRSTGLRWICTHGGEIYRAHRRVPWPGLAAVVVSVLHVHKGPFNGARHLDDAGTDRITAFLFHRGSHNDPARLVANAGKSFVGMVLRGMGFTFDDTDTKSVASPLADMRRLIAQDPRNREVIFPYIGGQEVNTSPTHAHHRYAINFHDYPLRRKSLGNSWTNATDEEHREWLRTGIVPTDYPGPVAADWPGLIDIVERRVRPARERLGNSPIDRTHKARWWQYANDRPELRTATYGLERVLTNSQISATVEFAFLPSDMVYAHTLNVYPLQTHAAFCALQSRPHEIWARFFGSSMKDDLRYTPSDCFETFPFPQHWETRPDLEAAGKAYYDFRAALMAENDEGLTRTYNRFHDPDEDDRDIARLRELHAALDRAVLDAYGWRDIPTDCEFLLDYVIDEVEWGARKKPYRYRWPDEVRDDVLARLLDLNAQRAAAEARSGAASTSPERPVARRSRASRAAEPRPLWGNAR